LAKRYGDVTAVAGVSTWVEPGEISGFLGPNGASKSTNLLMLATLAAPGGGRARVGGYDVQSQAAQVRRVSGVALQEIGSTRSSPTRNRPPPPARYPPPSAPASAARPRSR